MLMLQQRFSSAFRLQYSSIQHYSLQIYNSLSKSKQELQIPNRPLLWYSCGPTVYDESHLGHARNYVTQDIIYKIVTNYFHIPVILLMGITDIDDKIIQKAKTINKENIKQESQQIASLYERKFIFQMQQLGVEMPFLFTKVTEHVDSISNFIQQLQQNGLTYTIPEDGVYFDYNAFATLSKEKNFSSRSLALLQTSETSTVFQQVDVSKKKNPKDFVLWKFKQQEETNWWDSSFGNGRPGWHIECSAMIQTHFGSQIDIHSGGIDLAFPHHHNEILQSEGFNLKEKECKDWCQFFLHMGHLHIEGCKMSKSLKNFITIESFLKQYTSNQFRLFCLLNKYNHTVDFTTDVFEQHVKHVEAKVNDFISNLQFVYLKQLTQQLQYTQQLQEQLIQPMATEFDQIIFPLIQRFMNRKQRIHEALENDFDTPQVIAILLEQINDVYAHFPLGASFSIKHISNPSFTLLQSSQSLLHFIYSYFLSILSMLGISVANSTVSTEVTQKQSKIIDELVSFRHAIRQEMISNAQIPKETKQKLLGLCDSLRQVQMKELGISIQDHNNGSIWKYSEEMNNETNVSSDTNEAIAQKQKALEEKKKRMEERKNIKEEDYFRVVHADKFSKFDERGFPTHDQQGEPISKSLSKKLHKELEKHRELVGSKLG